MFCDPDANARLIGNLDFCPLPVKSGYVVLHAATQRGPRCRPGRAPVVSQRAELPAAVAGPDDQMKTRYRRSTEKC